MQTPYKLSECKISREWPAATIAKNCRPPISRALICRRDRVGPRAARQDHGN